MMKGDFRRSIVLVQILGFIGTIVLIWVFDRDTVGDIVMSGFICVLCIVAILAIDRSFQRVNYLEGLLNFCRSCKRVEVRENWIAIDRYLAKHSDVKILHGYCPECSAKQLRETKS
ncbi:MAG TPA: hypothetical protein VI758_09645 [Bacteroidota bacterium]